jgi:hypothetical protein
MLLLSWQSLVFLIPIGMGTALAIGAAFALGEDGVDQPAEGDDTQGEGGGQGHAPDIGRIPLTVRLMFWSLSFVGTGLCATYLMSGLDIVPPRLGTIIAAKLGLLLAFLVDRKLARLCARRLPLLETQTINRRDLLGSTGHAVLPIGPEGGLVQVHDRRGNLHQVPARTFPGEPALAAGAEVLLVDHDPQKGVFHATGSPLAPVTIR